MMGYKLVRDNIPKIIKEQNADGLLYARCESPRLMGMLLDAKLTEEVGEFREAVSKKPSPSQRERAIEEAADVMEVMIAIIDRAYGSEGTTPESLVEACRRKKEKNGGFDKGYVLFIENNGGKNNE